MPLKLRTPSCGGFVVSNTPFAVFTRSAAKTPDDKIKRQATFVNRKSFIIFAWLFGSISEFSGVHWVRDIKVELMPPGEHPNSLRSGH
jgi:hypothetical protein